MTPQDDMTRQTTRNDDDHRGDDRGVPPFERALELLDDLGEAVVRAPPSILSRLVAATRSIARVVRALRETAGDSTRVVPAVPSASTTHELVFTREGEDEDMCRKLIPMYESAYDRMRARRTIDALALDQLGVSLIEPLSTRTIAGQPMTPRDWAAIALAALDQAGAARTTTELIRVTLHEELGIDPARDASTSPCGSAEAGPELPSMTCPTCDWRGAPGAFYAKPLCRCEAPQGVLGDPAAIRRAETRGSERPAMTRELADEIARRAMTDRGLASTAPSEWVLDAMLEGATKASRSAAEPLERALRRASALESALAQSEAARARLQADSDAEATRLSELLQAHPVDADGRTFEQLNARLDQLRRDLATHRDACADQALQIAELRRGLRARGDDADRD